MSLKCYKYRLPFKNPLQTSKQIFEFREGFILEYSSGDFQCYGDIAPLPGFSKETTKEVRQKIFDLKDKLSDIFKEKNPIDSLQSLYKKQELPASLQFGLDSVAYQVEADRENSSLQNFLFEKTINEIPVNALGSLHSETFLSEIKKLVSQGFETIKFKIGIDFDTELQRLQRVRAEFPNLIIRLDANQAWSIQTALRYLPELEPLNIEYCEEPLRKATPKNYELLSQHTQLPLALDESVSHVSYWPNLLPFTSYFILKPMLLGSFTKNIETKRLIDTHNNKAVFTTTLESGVGRRMTAVLASGLGSPKTAHGLSTGKLLAKDVHSDMASISNGAYHVNQHQPRIDFHKLDDISLSYSKKR